MFKENIINLPFWTIIKMPIYKEYLNHTSGLTLSTPGLVYLSKLRLIKMFGIITSFRRSNFLSKLNNSESKVTSLMRTKVYNPLYFDHLSHHSGVWRTAWHKITARWADTETPLLRDLFVSFMIKAAHICRECCPAPVMSLEECPIINSAPPPQSHSCEEYNRDCDFAFCKENWKEDWT